MNVGGKKKRCARFPPNSFASPHSTPPPNFLGLPLLTLVSCTVCAWISAGLRLCETNDPASCCMYYFLNLCTFTYLHLSPFHFSTHSSFHIMYSRYLTHSSHQKLIPYGHDPTFEFTHDRFFPVIGYWLLIIYDLPSYYLRLPSPSPIVYSLQSDGFVHIHGQ